MLDVSHCVSTPRFAEMEGFLLAYYQEIHMAGNSPFERWKSKCGDCELVIHSGFVSYAECPKNKRFDEKMQ
ncbi:hypothetical protein AKJ16_DCAP14139 [Drosera capensis]